MNAPDLWPPCLQPSRIGYAFAIQLACVILCSCSPKGAAPDPPASDQARNGQYILFPDGTLLRFTNRSGPLIQGIRVELISPEGKRAKIKASTGAIREGGRVTQLLLTNAEVYENGRKASVDGEVIIDIHKPPVSVDRRYK